MSDSEEKKGKNHFREGKKHIEKGTQKVLREGLEKGKRKTEYYRKNRSQLIQRLKERFGDTKEPAASGIIVILPIAVVLATVVGFLEKLAGSSVAASLTSADFTL